MAFCFIRVNRRPGRIAMSTPDSKATKPEGPLVQSTTAITTTRDVDATAQPVQPSAMPRGGTPRRPGRPWWLWITGGVVALGALVAGMIWLVLSMMTVSTDDAYVNGHVTFVAPRVAGQVEHVLVDDNNRVHKGDVLVQLDPEPYQKQVNIAESAVEAARADLVAARAETRGTEGRVRSLRFALEHAIEDVNNQVAILRSKVATLQSQKASLAKAEADYERGKSLVVSGALSKEEFDLRKEALLVAQARTEEALQGVYQVRVALGLPDKPEKGDDLAHVPANLDQTFSTVRQAQASLLQAAAQLGISDSFNKSPKQMVADFLKRDPKREKDNDR